MGEIKATRTEYCHREDVNIVKYLRDRDSFHLCNGNLIWQKMEKAEVCPGRSFHSLRNRYLRNIQKRLKSDFRHILNQSPNRKRRPSLFKEPDRSFQPSSSSVKKKTIEKHNVDPYDDPEFEPTAKDGENPLKSIAIENVELAQDDENFLKSKDIENEEQKKLPAHIEIANNMSPVVVLTQLNCDGWLTAGCEKLSPNKPKRKRLYSDKIESDIILHEEPCNTLVNVDDTGSLYFSVACERNSPCLISQDIITSNDGAVRNTLSSSKITISNVKRFSKNTNELKEKVPCSSFDEAENSTCTQEVIDLTEKVDKITEEVENCLIENQSQHSTPSIIHSGASSQNDLFSPRQIKQHKESLENFSSTISPNSESFVSTIRTRRLVKSSPIQVTTSPNCTTALEYLGLVATVVRNQDIAETSAPVSKRNNLSIKTTENCNILPLLPRRSFNINSRINQHKRLSRCLLQIQQLINKFRPGTRNRKRYQRILNLVARNCLNLRGRKNIKGPTIKAKQKPAVKAQETPSSAQVPTRKSTRSTAGKRTPFKDLDEPINKTNTSTTKKSPKDNPQGNSVLLTNMLACLDAEKRKAIRKSLDEMK